ncbi:MAG: hypothetical protein P0Y55_06560 [Candidatus Cohnella colombiensis]|uniref:Uncharacterized protein n=1 Tax=Candidatus Cohnella colombiensis TaxID=3121368 RepID=A0AA95JE52_9BACL|nr:MAG: hypothetical protein P0Y55_06560 [Cohnella sp.]
MIKEYEKFLAEQIKAATGMRLEMLKKHGAGEKKLLLDILWPVFKSFNGIILEHEITTITGVKAYIDAYIPIFGLGIEGEGFVPHAEQLTRDRFDFSRNKIRSTAVQGITYFPFTWDEMDKKTELCKRSLYEFLGRKTTGLSIEYQQLSLHEREVLRYAIRLNRPIRLQDVCECLNIRRDLGYKVIRTLVANKIFSPLNPQFKRNHYYELVEEARKLLW